MALNIILTQLFVALGWLALGWLAGPRYTASGGTPNLGIYDQRLALERVQENFHHFGGDCSRVTVGGESAGAAITLHHLTAFGDTQPAPFQQAFLSSPAFNPKSYDWQQEETFNNFLQYANVTSFAELCAASSDTVIRANEPMVYNSTFGASGGTGPVVDGNIVPQLPALLLAQGRYAKNVRGVFADHNTNEWFIFTNPAIQNAAAFDEHIKDETLSHLLIFSNQTSIGYNDTISRLATLKADFLQTSNAYAAIKAFGLYRTHAHLFDVGLGLHGEDTRYVFYSYVTTQDVFSIGQVNATVAKAFQDWMLSSVSTGDSNGKGEVNLPVYDDNGTIGLMSDLGLGILVEDPAGITRDDFWEKGLYF